MSPSENCRRSRESRDAIKDVLTTRNAVWRELSET